MKITNKTGLQDFVYDKIKEAMNSYDLKRDPNVLSVTEILNDPKLFWLRRRHDKDAERDAVTGLYALQGTIMHELLGNNKDDNLEEIRLSYPVGNYTLSGKFDRYDNNGLWDYKYTSIWTEIYANKVKDWTWQLNMYAFMLRRAGFKVDTLTVIEMFRDWSATQVERGKYDFNPIKQIKLEVKPDNEIERFIKQRVTKIMSYKDTPDDDIPECSPENRWQDATKYAVVKTGNTRASKVCDTVNEAKTWMSKQKNYAQLHVEERPSLPKHCRDIIIDGINYGYCPYNKWCNWYKQWEKDKKRNTTT